ncbi:MAG: helix-turn-helix domain-containing protein [Spirochaetia bacterium]
MGAAMNGAQQMYRFLMVDDEEIVRRGFRRKIDWTSLDFEFLEPCENGEQAIEAMEALHPDVIMTDIAMPRVDGLEVAAYAAEHHPEIVIVILSGYDEFEYAQKAIKSNVFEYVLKPVTSRDLTGLLGRLKVRLDSLQRSREEAKSLEQRAEAAASLLRTRTLVDLVNGSAGKLTDARFQEIFGFPPQGLAGAVVIAEADPAGAGEHGVSTRLTAAAAEVAGFARRVLYFTPAEGREAVLVLEQDALSCDRLASAIAAQAAAPVGPSPSLGPTAIVAMGRPCESWREADRSFAEASAALSYRLVAPPGEVFRYGRAREDDPQTLEGLAEQRERACRAAVAGETVEAEVQAAAFATLLREAGISPQRVRHEIEALFAAVLDALRDLGVSPAAVAQDLHLDTDLAVQRLLTTEQVKALLVQLTVYAGSILDGRNLPAPEWKVRDFKDYVARHYGERALTVQNIAASLSISASYLSKLVKRHLDRSVVDYLIDYRMERAKELLTTSDLMTYEIAEATGYPDAQYFSTVFKRHIGITPTEFRAQRRGKTPSA